MRAVVVLPADRFSTTHHGKTVDDGTFTFFAFLSFSSISFFFFFFFFLFYSMERRMTRAVTKGHDGGRISRFLIKRPVPLGYHGHARHAIRVIAFRTILGLGFLNYSGVIAERPAIQCSLRSCASVLVITDGTQSKNLRTTDGKQEICAGYAHLCYVVSLILICL